MNTQKLVQMLLVAVLVYMAVTLMFHNNTPPGGAGGATGPATNSASSVIPLASTKPETWMLGNAQEGKPYKLALVISNIGAGIQSAQLNASEYRQTVGSDQPLTLLEAQDDNPLPFSTQSVTVNNQTYDISSQNWLFVQKNATHAVLALDLVDENNKPVAHLIKSFQIDTTSYDVQVNLQIQNPTGKPIQASTTMLGPTSLVIEDVMDKRLDSRTFLSAAYQTQGHYVDVNPAVYLKSMLGAGTTPKMLGDFTGSDRLLWIASSNRFFTVIMRPEPANGPMVFDTLDNGKQIPQINDLETAQVQRIGPNAEAADPMGACAVQVNSAALTIAPGSASSIPMVIYVGPKKRSLLAGSPDAPPNKDAYQYNLYNYLAVVQFNQGNICGFLPILEVGISWLALAILTILDKIHYVVGGNYGIAIMVLVLAIRLLLHPLTRYGQVKMTMMQRKMALVQPEISRLQKKYADDKNRQQQELMNVYKKYNINPAGGFLGCLPMVLQMPIWIALYSGLSVDIDLRQAGFIPGWINDLSSPDTLATLHTPFSVPFFGYSYDGVNYLPLNLLPILLGLAFFFQMRYQMSLAPVPADPQQRQTQMISQYMVLLFPIFLYNAPSGLNLYICASTAGGLFDSWLVRRHLKKLEERGIIEPHAAAKPPRR
ncbi:MAG TPA: YidC/Oxa1 family insertase periplasmic-domain containing protein [Phycisphaerae bacterium]|nr:YidC/Oxa1 family insertase periplasmic-domain containing protein [Phycisphaerae bacterium]